MGGCTNNLFHEAVGSMKLANFYSNIGNLSDAETYLLKAHKLFQKQSIIKYHVRTLLNLVRLFNKRKKYSETIKLCENSLSLIQANNSSDFKKKTYIELCMPQKK